MTRSELEEAVSRSGRQKECSSVCVCVCVCTCPCVEQGAGFSLGRHRSGETHTDPWVLLTQGIVFHFIYCSWQRHCLGNHGASPLLAGASCVSGVGHSEQPKERGWCCSAPGTQRLTGLFRGSCTSGKCCSGVFLCCSVSSLRRIVQHSLVIPGLVHLLMAGLGTLAAVCCSPGILVMTSNLCSAHTNSS